MGDCNFSLPFSHPPESRDKFCKYPYSSWCTNCERNSPRRRSRSETNESCRKKCKEMKTLTPKKHNRCNEFENRDMEYEFKGWHESKFDCCRIRSNLVELPTSYISNNCQPSHNVTVSKTDTECLKTVNGLNKFVDIKTNYETLESMEYNGKIIDSVKSLGKYGPTTCQSYTKCSSFHQAKSKFYSESEDVQNANMECEKTHFTNCREYCLLSDYKGQDIANQKPLCFETDTYFDRPIDRDRYSKEIDRLKEKLRILRNGVYANHDVKVINLDIHTGDHLRETFIATPIEIKPKIVKKEKKGSTLKSSKGKVSLKVKRNNINKTRKLKEKTVINETEGFQGEDSGSESDTVEDDTLDEEPDSLSSDPISTDESIKDSSTTLTISQTGSGESVFWPVRSSLFPNIPPYIKFRSYELESPYKLPAGRKFFKWKLSTITPVIVRKTLTNSGFVLVRKSNQWLGTWGKHMKSPMFKTLKETQKLNHFPGTFQLGRKDRLWRNFQRMISKYGLKEFGFLPHTYVLPQEVKLLKQNWDFKNNSGKEMWIIKPPASARGTGIKVINKWSQLPKKTSLVCQKYVNNPYLINGSKFDLRLYVLVTSFHPLRIYLYPDGLARFASAKYSDDVKDLKDRYMHLTNYSINKLSSQYTANEDANACHGHKWTLTKLLEYMHNEGVDTKTLWRNLQQLVIKTIISSEPLITPLCEENMNSYYNCYELFGIDVLLDEHLKPWLLEVNISPSLHSASPLDSHVKGPLVQTLFDMAQFHFPVQLSQTVKNPPQCFDKRLYTRGLTKKERYKHQHFTEFESREDYVYDILKDLTGDDVRQLIRAEDEYVVKGKFERIFPTAHTYKYLEFMEARYYNRLFDAWETKYASRREDGIALLQTLCAQKVHLKIANQSTISKNCLNMTLGVETMNIQPSLEGQSHPLDEIMKATMSKEVTSIKSDCTC